MQIQIEKIFAFIVKQRKLLPAGNIRRVFNRIVSTAGIKIECQTIWGGKFRCDPRDVIQNRLLYHGVWEPALTRYVEAILRPGDSLLDIGANVGYYSILAGMLVGEEGQVFAVEPMPETVGALRVNIALNGLDNITVIERAVTTSPNSLTMYYGPVYNSGKSSAIMDRAGSRAVTVQGERLESLLSPEEVSRIRMVKIDIEGGELRIIAEIAANPGYFDPGTTFMIELSIAANDDERIERRRVMQSFIDQQYHIYVVENRYDDAFYDDELTADRMMADEVTDAESLPDGQCDLILSRRKIDDILQRRFP